MFILIEVYRASWMWKPIAFIKSENILGIASLNIF